jgi:hypothetical protein
VRRKTLTIEMIDGETDGKDLGMEWRTMRRKAQRRGMRDEEWVRRGRYEKAKVVRSRGPQAYPLLIHYNRLPILQVDLFSANSGTSLCFSLLGSTLNGGFVSNDRTCEAKSEIERSDIETETELTRHHDSS